MELWYEACSLLSIEDVDPMGAELKRVSLIVSYIYCAYMIILQILERTPQFRGQVRDKASLLVVHAYNFTDIRVLGKKLTKDEITEITSQNRDIYASLKDKFWYKVRVSLPSFVCLT
jgi:polyferredoxin